MYVNKKKKNQGTHIKEIQDFKNYFKVVYNPYQLSQIIYGATSTLKPKIIEKILKLHFSPCIKERYDFALEFHLPKFPSLPISEFNFG